MTRIDESAWIAKAERRKAVRDRQRAKFWREVGLAAGSDVQGLSGAPKDQVAVVQDLLAMTAGGSVPDAGHKDSIAVARSALGTVGMGLGVMGGTGANVEQLEAVSMVALNGGWFTSGAFFE